MMDTPPKKVRIDKWLWAARFFKTRSLAKQAIDGGKVHMQGQRVKASKEIEAGDVIQVRQGWDEKEIVVSGLSEQRGPAAQATQLYDETPESIRQRQKQTEQRRLNAAQSPRSSGKPTTKQRRHIHRFKREVTQGDN